MDLNIFNKEKEYLQTIKEKLSYAHQTLESTLTEMGKENLDTLKDLRENPETSGLDAFLFMEQLHEKNTSFNFKDKLKRLDELEFLKKEPYFSRIDLKNPEEEQSNSYYIGKFGYTEENPVITDWRAKVASVYYRYRYPQKNVKYETPEGPIVKDLELKRTYEIEEGELLKYYNNDLKLDENEIISEKIEQRTGGVLEDIVETIQVSQLDIIEADPRQVCIVQGCVGSGKSTVAIHKLAHIFFNYPELIHPERSILIAKNQILVGYLSTLFPKLGIFDVNYKTVADLLIQIIFRQKLDLKTNFSLNKRIDFGISQLNGLKAKLRKIHEKSEKLIKKEFEKDEFESFGGFVYDTQLSVTQNINDVITDLDEELAYQKEMLKENPKSPQEWLYKSNISDLRRLISGLRKIRKDIEEKDFKKLLSEVGIDKKKELSYQETLIYVLIYSQLFDLDKTYKYEYCVVDEGQDFSPLEYSLLNELVLNGRFCILGDLNQSYQQGAISNWEDIYEVIESAANANTFELTTNYRSTKPIIDLANEILSPHTDTYLPQSINRVGAEPSIQKFQDAESLFDNLKQELQNDTQNLDKSIGIIYLNPAHEDVLEKIISEMNVEDGKYIKLDSSEKIYYVPKGVYLTSFDNCKGLEFAKVYVVDLNLENVKGFEEAKKAFVAVTRAMNEVSIYGLLNDEE